MTVIPPFPELGFMRTFVLIETLTLGTPGLACRIFTGKVAAVAEVATKPHTSAIELRNVRTVVFIVMNLLGYVMSFAPLK